MFILNSSPTVMNCVFSGNVAVDGGGMYNRNGSNPTVINCTFNNNMATDGTEASVGGGMANMIDSSPTVSNCTFSGNFGREGGGGMFNHQSNPAVTNCTFSDNVSLNGAGMYNQLSGPTVANCVFVGNTAGSVGQGTLGGGMYNLKSNPSVTDCIFSENSSSGGGGMANRQCDPPPEVRNCTFRGNTAGDGGGMFNIDGSNTIVVNCRFIENVLDALSNSEGGGMGNVSSSPTVTNCEFVGNIATDAPACYGGGMSNAVNSNPTVTNCTFVANWSDDWGAGMYNGNPVSNPMVTNCIFWGNATESGTSETDQIYNDGASAPDVAYSCIQGCDGTFCADPDDYNLGDDPLFVDADGEDGIPGTGDDNLHLLLNSPCIDAGDNAAVPEDVATDLDGNARIVDGDGDGESTVDMGAYEFQCPPGACAADLNGDCKVDAADLAILLGSWGACPVE